MHYLSAVYFVKQPLHVSGIFVPHHQEVYCIYTRTTTGTCCAFQLPVCWPVNRQSTEKYNTYQMLYIYSTPPGDGLQICPKHVEVFWRNKLRINSAASWSLLHRCIEMHGQQNKKRETMFHTHTKNSQNYEYNCVWDLCSSRVLRSVESRKREHLICIATEVWSHAHRFVCFYLLNFFILKREDGWFWTEQ